MMDVEEFLKRLQDGERFFLDIEFPRGVDIRELVPKINAIIKSSIEEENPVTFDGCYFQEIKADGIYLEALNSVWDNEKKLYFLDSSLKNSNFRGSNLKNAVFTNSDLSSSNFDYANLEHAEMKGVDLTGATLREAHLESASFVGANLEEADLSESVLHAAVFANSNLHKANLAGCEIFDTDFRESDLSKANLRCICGSGNFSDVLFDKAKIEEVDISHSIFERASFRKSIIKKSSFHKVDFSDANFERAIFQCSYIKHASFEAVKLNDADFSNNEIELVDFSKADMRGTDLRGTKLWACFFYRTDLRGVKNLESVRGIDTCLFLDVILTEKEKSIIEKKTNKRKSTFVVRD